MLSPKSKPYFASVGIFLILCSKFYYLWGFTHWPRLDAPVALILVRDVIACGFLFYFGFQNRHDLLKSKFFWIVWLMGLATSLYQLAGPKDFATWTQHYFRNSLIPLFFFPVILSLLKNGSKIHLKPVLISVFVINILVSYAQIFLVDVVDRPRGLFGDPIINSMALFWGLGAVLTLERRSLTLLAIIAFVPLLQYLSSLSAIGSFIFAGLMLGYLTKESWLKKIKENFKFIVGLAAVIIALVIAIPWIGQQPRPPGYEIATSKFQLLYQSLTCQDPSCHQWFLKGRINSNLRPIQICKEDLTSCFVGNRKTDLYERLDATWASLIANWGLLFCLPFLIWIFRHFLIPFQLLKKKNFDDKHELLLWNLIFYSSFAYSLFNAVIYKFPINIMLYASMAYLSYRKDRS